MEQKKTKKQSNIKSGKTKKPANKKNSRISKGWILSIVLAAVLVVVVLVAGISSCGRAKRQSDIPIENDSQFLDDSKWITQNGFKIYDDPDYECVTGIDVSEWVNGVDWQQVKDSGIDFAILRVGYRGYETARFVFDNSLHTFLYGCNEVGLPVGVYFVSQAINEEEAVEEAEKILENIQGYEVTMPIYIDLEGAGETARTKDLTAEEYTQIVNAFCRRIEKEGYRAGVYSNENWIRSHLNWDDLSEWDLWFAKYTKVPSTDHAFNMWQYTESAKIPGVEKECDLNVRVYEKEKNE